MNKAKFVHYNLELFEPSFNSHLTDLIIELDYLRKKSIEGSTPPYLFFQLKHIFQTIESIGSARIEGNNTTITEYIETKFETPTLFSPNIQEIWNIEEAMKFIEENVKENPINNRFISELHKLVVKDLEPPPNGEGDILPGQFRKVNPKILKSTHLPPDYLQVDNYMEELVRFINKNDSPKYDLLKTAIAHHRFVWIHPFGNGNGRTVRLFTYAMLVKTGFNIDEFRMINPTAIFCNNRQKYYDFLSKADQGNRDGILAWSEYVLEGLKNEIEKIDKLLNFDFLLKEILIPTFKFAKEREYITDTEEKILRFVAEKNEIVQASDLKHFFPNKISAEVSRQIKKLRDKKILMPEEENSRKYILRFDNNYLLRSLLKVLDEKGFLPINDR